MARVSTIDVCDAWEGNLKGVSCSIPRGRLVSLIGPSGSGKTTFLFEVIAQEALSRYSHGLSPEVASVFGSLKRAQVASISGLSFVVSIQSGTRRDVLSSLATVSDVYHHLVALFLGLGRSHCVNCDIELSRTSVSDVLRELADRDPAGRISVFGTYALVDNREWGDTQARLLKLGFTRFRVANKVFRLEDQDELPDTDGSLDILLDSFGFGQDVEARLLEVSQFAWKNDLLGLEVELVDEKGLLTDTWPVTNDFVCRDCGYRQEELHRLDFSYFSRRGRCCSCDGSGLLDEGVCVSCHGSRLLAPAHMTRVNGLSFSKLMASSVSEVEAWLIGCEQEILDSGYVQILSELRTRLSSLMKLGLSYVELGRSVLALSGGEFRRAVISRYLGSAARGLVFAFDEPSIGLHPKDIEGVVVALKKLRDSGNTVMVIEHDPEIIRQSDFVLEFGPGGGALGGELVFSGSLGDQGSSPDVKTVVSSEIQSVSESPTELGDSGYLSILGADKHNLQSIDVDIPLGFMTALCGVSGSGKSSLIFSTLMPAINALLQDGSVCIHQFGLRELKGWDKIQKVSYSDRVFSGRGNYSVVATSLKVFKPIRELFSQTILSRMRGYSPEFFSFVRGKGRCFHCKGAGLEEVDSVSEFNSEVVCRVCKGSRFSIDVSEVHYRGLKIGEVLEKTVDDCVELFANITRISSPLRVVSELGLGYLTLGSPIANLSLGERQRLSLSQVVSSGARGRGRKIKSRGGQGKVLYLFDEPTEGLHSLEVRRLVSTFRDLVSEGNTVVVIEHNAELLSCADFLVELGPGPGVEGGRVIARGRPEELSRNKESLIGPYISGIDILTPHRPI